MPAILQTSVSEPSSLVGDFQRHHDVGAVCREASVWLFHYVGVDCAARRGDDQRLPLPGDSGKNGPSILDGRKPGP